MRYRRIVPHENENSAVSQHNGPVDHAFQNLSVFRHPEREGTLRRTLSGSRDYFTPNAPPSCASSSTETNDQLGPLSGFADQDRTNSAQSSNASSRNQSLYPLPSPVLAGISELLAGPSHGPGYEASYFPPSYAEYSKSLGRSPRHRSISSSKSYPHPMLDSTNSDPYDPQSPSYGLAQTPTPTDERPQGKSASDSGLILRQTQRPMRSPRIRNTDAALAPHGSFTSSRQRSSTISSRASAKSSATNKNVAASQNQLEEMDPVEREKWFRAAAKGDQLAMYKLGYRPASEHRHTLGSVGDVASNATPRSSISSGVPSEPTSVSPIPDQRRASMGANHIASDSIPLPESIPGGSVTPSDLFSDAAQLALRSNTRT
ncbi:hypothetical protein CI109_103573 [Kwoniella shandongensis]|uniref:Uncharacterized protein n=1 Tax=Kwoniella shandongensis TaxID=1734106 RepID=A0AAJ8MVM0_9TREE